jgi:hypothetical protein
VPTIAENDTSAWIALNLSPRQRVVTPYVSVRFSSGTSHIIHEQVDVDGVAGSSFTGNATTFFMGLSIAPGREGAHSWSIEAHWTPESLQSGEGDELRSSEWGLGVYIGSW